MGALSNFLDPRPSQPPGRSSQLQITNHLVRACTGLYGTFPFRRFLQNAHHDNSRRKKPRSDFSAWLATEQSLHGLCSSRWHQGPTSSMSRQQAPSLARQLRQTGMSRGLPRPTHSISPAVAGFLQYPQILSSCRRSLCRSVRRRRSSARRSSGVFMDSLRVEVSWVLPSIYTIVEDVGFVEFCDYAENNEVRRCPESAGSLRWP